MMKRALLFWFSLPAVLLISTTAISCKAKKIPIHNETKETNNEKDFTSVKQLIEVNKEITDQLIWQLSQVQTGTPECDSITRAYLFQVLNSMNVDKQSGDNGYSLKFNELLQRMELSVKIAETTNKTKDSIHDRVIERHYSTRVEIPVEVPLKWYEKTLMLIGLILGAWQVFKIINFIKGKLPTKN
ncbi:hypothetical protein ACI6PS_03630 [Flavobacterium sp. PLA-1-15]|uniref:hypothetical protein n=1 Tax=Flavobacterium sp. PLA-1-15 TaxID=3380533 RepID=UPI003B76B127